MDNYYDQRVNALLISKLASLRLDIRDAFRKRHNSLIDNQNYLVVESKIREYRTWLYMSDLIDKQLNQ